MNENLDRKMKTEQNCYLCIFNFIILIIITVITLCVHLVNYDLFVIYYFKI